MVLGIEDKIGYLQTDLRTTDIPTKPFNNNHNQFYLLQ